MKITPINDLSLPAAERLDSSLKSYLAMLALTQPFSLEISAEPALIFEELAANWPKTEGWSTHAVKLQQRIEELLEPLIDHNKENHMRLTVRVAANPNVIQPEFEASSVYAIFDANAGTIQHGVFVPHDDQMLSNFDLISMGMTVLCQLYNTEGEARVVGMGSSIH